jgi:hypothetical protein
MNQQSETPAAWAAAGVITGAIDTGESNPHYNISEQPTKVDGLAHQGGEGRQ